MRYRSLATFALGLGLLFAAPAARADGAKASKWAGPHAAGRFVGMQKGAYRVTRGRKVQHETLPAEMRVVRKGERLRINGRQAKLTSDNWMVARDGRVVPFSDTVDARIVGERRVSNGYALDLQIDGARATKHARRYFRREASKEGVLATVFGARGTATITFFDDGGVRAEQRASARVGPFLPVRLKGIPFALKAAILKPIFLRGRPSAQSDFVGAPGKLTFSSVTKSGQIEFRSSTSSAATRVNRWLRTGLVD